MLSWEWRVTGSGMQPHLHLVTPPPAPTPPQDIFYEKADALVGVARDGDLACSRTFTFDLNRFEAPDQEETGV